MPKRKKRNGNRTGCFACKKKHNTNTVHMVRVERPDRGEDSEATVHVCQEKAGEYVRV